MIINDLNLIRKNISDNKLFEIIEDLVISVEKYIENRINFIQGNPNKPINYYYNGNDFIIGYNKNEIDILCKEIIESSNSLLYTYFDKKLWELMTIYYRTNTSIFFDNKNRIVATFFLEINLRYIPSSKHQNFKYTAKRILKKLDIFCSLDKSRTIEDYLIHLKNIEEDFKNFKERLSR